MKTQLKPCPFCGGNAILKDYGIGTGGYMISCSNRCGVLMTGGGKNGNKGRGKEIHEEIRIAVIQNWNRRHLKFMERSTFWKQIILTIFYGKINKAKQ